MLSPSLSPISFVFFFFNDTATTEIYTLSLHDALPIYRSHELDESGGSVPARALRHRCRSEEHTSELQSQSNLVCRLLLEKKKKTIKYQYLPVNEEVFDIMNSNKSFK